MSASEFISSIAAFLAILISAETMLIAWRKAPREAQKTSAETGDIEADAAGKWQEIARKSAEQIIQLNARVEALEKTAQAQDERIKQLEEENADLRDWADRLVQQLKAQGLEPVKLRRAKIGA